MLRKLWKFRYVLVTTHCQVRVSVQARGIGRRFLQPRLRVRWAGSCPQDEAGADLERSAAWTLSFALDIRAWGSNRSCAAFHGTAAAGKQRTAAVRVCCASRGLMVAGRSRAAAVTEASDVERERRQLANTSKMSRTQKATGSKGGKLEKRIGEDADSQSKDGGSKQVKSHKSIQSLHTCVWCVCVCV